jgi:DNA-binding PadR family transcriptional regulator
MMDLTDLERDFRKRLFGECWGSPPMFDHELVARLVELGLVETEPLPSGDVEYRITEAGRAAAAGGLSRP